MVVIEMDKIEVGEVRAVPLPVFDVPETWPEPSDRSRSAMQAAYKISRTKHGLMSSIPLVCYGERCPYAKTCSAMQMGNAPTGERCPIEIVEVTTRYEKYKDSLELNPNNMAEMTLLKELIDSDIMIERANKLIADGGGIITDVVSIVSEAGDVYTKPEISKAVDIKDKYVKRKGEILQLLNSTPKDKAKDGPNALDASQYAADILAKFMAKKG